MAPPSERQHKTYDEIVIPLLAQRSCHLPGNSWTEDWVQWMKNNHIVFGTCFHHRLHPIETWERVLVLGGSIAFAVVATNVAYVWDWVTGDENQFDPGVVVYSFTIDNGNDGDDDDGIDETTTTTYNITYGILLLWTFGSIFHALFDILIWNLSACACLHPGGKYGNTVLGRNCKDLGSYVLVPPVLGLLTLAGYSSYLRVTNSNERLEEAYENTDDIVEAMTGNVLGEFTFLVRIGIEMALTWFLFFPVVSTVIFSGILGCNGRLPLLGGRPRDKKLLEERQARIHAII